MRYLYFIRTRMTFLSSVEFPTTALSPTGRAADECTVAHLGVFADDDRSVQIGAVKYLRCLVNPDVFTTFLIFCRI